MTDAPPTAPPEIHVRPRGRVWRRRAGIAAMVPILVAAGVWLTSPKWRLITNIWAGGGTYYCKQYQPFHERLMLLWAGKPIVEERVVALRGAGFDDAWLAERDDLALLQPTSLSLFDTGLSREAVRRLVTRYHFWDCYIVGTPVTDEDAALLALHPQLRCVVLRGTEITGDGLALLTPVRLHYLDVSNSPVSSTALQTQLMGATAAAIGLDGRQFTPELVTVLASLTNLQDVSLVGPEVTDAQLGLLMSVPKIRRVFLEQTSVSDEAIDALRADHPNPALLVQRIGEEPAE